MWRHRRGLCHKGNAEILGLALSQTTCESSENKWPHVMHGQAQGLGCATLFHCWQMMFGPWYSYLFGPTPAPPTTIPSWIGLWPHFFLNTNLGWAKHVWRLMWTLHWMPWQQGRLWCDKADIQNLKIHHVSLSWNIFFLGCRNFCILCILYTGLILGFSRNNGQCHHLWGFLQFHSGWFASYGSDKDGHYLIVSGDKIIDELLIVNFVVNF